MLATSLKVGSTVYKELEKERRFLRTAAQVSLQKTSFEERTQIKADLKKGNLGLATKTKLQKGKKKRKSAPLAKLMSGVFYTVDKLTLKSQMGFTGTKPGAMWQGPYAEKSIPGYQWVYTPKQIAALHKRGIHLRKETTSAQVPARDIIGMAGAKDEPAIIANYNQYFARKMRGERI